MSRPSLPNKQVFVRFLIVIGVGFLFITSLSWHSPFASRARAQTPAAPMDKMATPKPDADLPTGLTVISNGGGKAPRAFLIRIEDLQALPQQTVTVYNGHTKANETYSGPSLGDVLARCCFVVEQATRATMLHSYVTAEGSDEYEVLYSLTEVEPSQHNGDVIVAMSIDGHGLGVDGELKLISTEDKKPQRWVRNLERITIVNTE